MVIESAEEFQQFFESCRGKSIIIIPILCDQKLHALNNELCFLFVKILFEPEYYILPFNHNECMNLDLKYLIDLNTDCKKYTFDKKWLLNIFEFSNTVDINLMHYLDTNSSLDLNSLHNIPKSHALIQREFDGMKNLNKSMPILKYYEDLTSLSDKLEAIIVENISMEDEPYFDFINNDTILELQKIEKEGLFLDTRTALEHFPHAKRHITHSNLIYTEYNNYTATGRPSNRFGNINFAALNKETGERSMIISRFGDNGKLIMFDYDAYHIMLIAQLINYQFPTEMNVHEFLGRQYFLKESLTEDDYEESKAVTFNIIYGGIDDSVSKTIPFFGKVKEYIDSTWEKVQTVGYAESIISKRKIYIKNFTNPNRNKLFNYILQNFETERNMLVMKQIHDLLKYKESKLILYLYDGFLFDMHSSEYDLVPQIKQLLEENEFKTKVYEGKDFHNMIKIDAF